MNVFIVNIFENKVLISVFFFLFLLFMNITSVVQREKNKCIIKYYMFFKVSQISIIFMFVTQNNENIMTSEQCLYC